MGKTASHLVVDFILAIPNLYIRLIQLIKERIEERHAAEWLSCSAIVNAGLDVAHALGFLGEQMKDAAAD